MNRNDDGIYDDDHQALAWVKGRALYAAHLLVVALVATMLATTALLALRTRSAPAALGFDSEAVFAGEIWRALTHGLLNIPGWGFAIDMVLVAWAGRELERSLGRRAFLRLYAVIYLVPPITLAMAGLLARQSLAGHTGAASVFIAFAVLHPRVTPVFNLPAAVCAALIVGLQSLVALAARDWPGLIALWSAGGFALAYARRAQGRPALPLPRLAGLRWKQRASAARHGPPENPRAHNQPVRSTAGPDMAEVDALLEKIGQSGLDSLTPHERARLSEVQKRLARRHHRA